VCYGNQRLILNLLLSRFRGGEGAGPRCRHRQKPGVNLKDLLQEIKMLNAKKLNAVGRMISDLRHLRRINTGDGGGT